MLDIPNSYTSRPAEGKRMENITQQQAENGLFYVLNNAHFTATGERKGNVVNIKKHDDGTIVMELENGQHIVVWCKVTNG